jgi:hypothetical protein
MPARPANDAPHRLIRDVTFGDGVLVRSFTNPYGRRIVGERVWGHSSRGCASQSRSHPRPRKGQQLDVGLYRHDLVKKSRIEPITGVSL